MATYSIPELDRKGLRDFGLTTGLAVALIFGLALPWLFEFPLPLWPWILFAILGACGLIAPLILRPVYRTWMRFGLLLSRITTPLILGIVFFGMVFPMSLVMRMMRYDPLARKLNVEQDSYRVNSKKAPPENLEKPF